MLTSLRRVSIRRTVCWSVFPSGTSSFGARCFASTDDTRNSSGSKEDEKIKSAHDDAQESPSVGQDDAYLKVVQQLEQTQGSITNLHRELLLKYANAENKRRERIEEIKRRDTQHISKFGDKTLKIYESLVKVCDQAQQKAAATDADDKVKSLAEGLVMTQGIMRNILSKHGIMQDSK